MHPQKYNGIEKKDFGCIFQDLSRSYLFIDHVNEKEEENEDHLPYGEQIFYIVNPPLLDEAQKRDDDSSIALSECVDKQGFKP